MKTYFDDRLALLRRRPAFRSLLGARLVSELCTWLAYVALGIQMYDLTGSATWLSALLAVEFLPGVFLCSVLAPLFDRVERKHLLIGGDVTSLLVFAALPLAGGPVALVLLAGIAGLSASVLRPALDASLPNLVDDDELPQANGLLQTVESFGLTLGPLLAAALVAVVGTSPIYLLNAASFLCSALLVARIPRRSLHAEPAAGGSHWRSLAAGLRGIAGTRVLVAVLVSWALVTLTTALINVGEIVLVLDVFDAGRLGFGLLASAAGVGYLLGGLVSPPLLERCGARSVYTSALLAAAAGVAGAAFSPLFWLVLPCVVFMTAANGVALAGRALIVQRTVPDEVRGRTLALFAGSWNVALMAGMAGGGVLIDTVGARGGWAAGAILLLAAATVAALVGRPGVAAQPLPAPARA
jgi:MFS family permease